MKFLMERPALFNAALWAAPIVNGLPRFMKYNDLDDWGKGRELPEFAGESFNEMWKKNKVQGKEESKCAAEKKYWRASVSIRSRIMKSRI